MEMGLTEQARREVGQHFVFGFHGYEASEDVKTLITEYFVGSIILMKRNVQNAKQVRSLVTELQDLARKAGHSQPLVIGTDQECGLVSAMTSVDCATQFPGAMTLAATDSLSLTESVYEATGKELRALGLHWAYSPVADVNCERRNPVIGVRSFGDNPTRVGEFTTAATTGLVRAGIATCAKHFPGHGDTHVDSHLALPIIQKTKDQLDRMELVPFWHLTRPGPTVVASIMTAHVALPLVTGSNEPSTLSRKITKGILRDEMGYQGVIVTDCLEMDAIADVKQGGPGIPEGTVRALEASNDIVMICHTFKQQIAAINATYEAIESGRLNLTDLSESGKRIAAMKSAFVADDVAPLDLRAWELLKHSNAQLSRDAYEASVAVIHKGVGLPLSKGTKVAIFTPAITGLNKAVDDAEGVLRGKGGQVRNTAGESFAALARSIGTRAHCEHTVYSSNDPSNLQLISECNAVVLVLRTADRASWQLQFLDKVKGVTSSLHAIPLILIASCTPYDLVGVEGLEDYPYLACFEYTPPAFEAVTKVIFGEIEAKGRVPVNISLNEN